MRVRVDKSMKYWNMGYMRYGYIEVLEYGVYEVWIY